jgi:hypothetical protein
MRPRSIGKIVVGTLCVVCILTALIYAIQSPDPDEIYKSIRGISYGVLALTFATLYRYFED